MALCDECSCFDDNHIDGEDFTEEQLEKNTDYKPDRYYFWHGDIQEDYQMPRGYECLCDRCFGDLLSDDRIIEKHLDNGQINPIWNDETMGWFMPIEEVAQ